MGPGSSDIRSLHDLAAGQTKWGKEPSRPGERTSTLPAPRVGVESPGLLGPRQQVGQWTETPPSSRGERRAKQVGTPNYAEMEGRRGQKV